MRTMEIVTPSKTYPLLIGRGIRHELRSLLSEIPKSFSSFLLITDDVVAEHYLDDVLKAIDTDVSVYHYVVPHGEQAKSFETYQNCQTFAIEKGLDRKSTVLALGGGVIGDLAGFVAATFMRGIGFIQIPTTLLAHDSSVGGKTAINHPLGKNLIGSFYQPDAVIFDTETLDSLPERERLSGFAEVMKHGLIGDVSLYEKLRKEIDSFEELQRFSFEEILEQAIAVKAAIVRQDEMEFGVRSHLNFGHTLGHALEVELGYGEITHGEAVVIGMVFAMRVSEAYYDIKLPIDDFTSWLERLHYRTSIPEQVQAESLLKRMKHDKKIEKNRLRFIVMRHIGEVESVFVEDELILSMLKR